MSDYYPSGTPYGFVQPNPPCAPVLALLDVGDGTVTLGVAVDCRNCGYAIFMGTVTGEEDFSAVVATGARNQATVQITGLTNGTTYYFVAKTIGCNGQGYGNQSNEVSGTPLANGPPVLALTACNGEIEADWSLVPGASSYNLYEVGQSHDVPTVMVLGTADPIVAYGGNAVTVGALKSFRLFAGEGTPVDTNLPIVINDGTSVVRSVLNGDALYTVNGGGHAWPDSTAFSPPALGKVSKNLDTTGLLIALAPGSNGAGTATAVRSTPTIAGRQTIVYRPVGVVSPPVVVLLHGRDQPILGMQNMANAARIAGYGFLVVIPSTPGNTWNSGQPSPPPNQDDLAYLSSMLDALAVAYNINAAQVTFAGMSGGAFMSAYYALTYPSRVAALFMVAGTFYTPIYNEFALSLPINVSAPPYTISPLTNGVAKTYEVTAIMNGVETAPSNQATATPTALTTPVVTVSSITGGYRFSWPTQLGVSYAVFRATTPGGEAPPPIFTLNGTGGTVFVDMVGLSNGTYYLTVEATNACGQTATSTEFSVVFGVATPTGFALSPCDGQLRASWTPQLADSFNVYLGTAPGGEPGTPNFPGLTGSSATLTGLTDGVTYYGYITAVVSASESAPSTEASGTPVALTAPTPTSTLLPAGIRISVASSVAGDTYDFYAGTTPGGESATPFATVTGTGGTITADFGGALTTPATYYFKVKVTNGCGQSQTSAELTVVFIPAPVNFRIFDHATDIARFQWNVPAGLSLAAPPYETQIFISTTSGGEGGTPQISPFNAAGGAPGTTQLTELLPGSSVVPPSLDPGSTRYLTIQTKNVSTSNVSAMSNEIAITMYDDLSTATTHATPGSHSATFSWTLPSNLDPGGNLSYIWGTDPTFATYDGFLPLPGAGPVVISGLPSGVLRYFAVFEVDSRAAVFYSPVASCTPT